MLRELTGNFLLVRLITDAHYRGTILCFPPQIDIIHGFFLNNRKTCSLLIHVCMIF